MSRDLHVTPGRLGLLVTAFAAVMAVSAAPLGFVTSRFPPRALLVATLLGYATSNAVMTVCSSYWVALGARRSEVVGMILRDSARMLMLGLVIGAGLSLAATRGAGALLFDIEPWDVTTLVVAAGLLAVVTVAASWIPARRAAGLDPLSALRHD